MPETQAQLQQQGRAMGATPLERAYQTSLGGFESLIGSVQQRIEHRRQVRQMETELEQRKDIITHQIEEQDRIRRAYHEDIEQPMMEAEQTQQQAQLQQEMRENMTERLRETRKQKNEEIRKNFSNLTRIPQFQMPMEYAFGEQIGDQYQPDEVYAAVPDFHDPDSDEINWIRSDQLLSRYQQYRGVGEFIDEFERNYQNILPDYLEDDHDGRLLNRTDAQDLIDRLKTGNASPGEIEEINRGFYNFAYDERTDQQINEQNSAMGDLNGIWNQMRMFLGSTEYERSSGLFGTEEVSIDLFNNSLAEIRNKIDRAYDEHNIDPEDKSHGVNVLRDFLRAALDSAGHANIMVNPDKMYINPNRTDMNDPNDLFLFEGDKTESPSSQNVGGTERAATRQPLLDMTRNLAPKTDIN